MNNVYHIYTDGSARGNPGSGGYGVVVLNEIEDTVLYCYNEREDYTTNNREELKAIIHALEYTTLLPEQDFIIHSDSAYCVNICNDWIWKWANNDWCNSKKQIIENYNLVKEIYDFLLNHREFPNFSITKVSGHNGVIGNELADAAATGNKKKFFEIIINNNLKEEYKEF